MAANVLDFSGFVLLCGFKYFFLFFRKPVRSSRLPALNKCYYI